MAIVFLYKLHEDNKVEFISERNGYIKEIKVKKMNIIINNKDNEGK